MLVVKVLVVFAALFTLGCLGVGWICWWVDRHPNGSPSEEWRDGYDD